VSSDTTINDLSPADIVQAEQFLTTWIQEEYPSMDLSEGRVLRDLLIRPAALFHVLNATDMDNLRRSMSLKAIEEDPTLADDDIVDGILSNYRVTRDAGAKSSGYVSIIISSLRTTTVPAGTVFTSGTLTFVTTSPYIGVTTSAAVVTAQEKLITARTDGTYVFTIPAEASAIGADYNIRMGTRFTVSPSPAGLASKAYLQLQMQPGFT